MTTPITGIRLEKELKSKAASVFSRKSLSFGEGVRVLLEEAASGKTRGISLMPDDRTDYISEYLSPIRCSRFEKPVSIGRTPAWIRRRLASRRGALWGK